MHGTNTLMSVCGRSQPSWINQASSVVHWLQYVNALIEGSMPASSAEMVLHGTDGPTTFVSRKLGALHFFSSTVRNCTPAGIAAAAG